MDQCTSGQVDGALKDHREFRVRVLICITEDIRIATALIRHDLADIAETGWGPCKNKGLIPYRQNVLIHVLQINPAPFRCKILY